MFYDILYFARNQFEPPPHGRERRAASSELLEFLVSQDAMKRLRLETGKCRTAAAFELPGGWKVQPPQLFSQPL